MNCIQYVLDNLTKTESEKVTELIRNKTYIRNLSLVKPSDIVIFTQGWHIGFAQVNQYLELRTNEMESNFILNRNLYLYDSRLRIVLINPKLKKGRLKEWEKGY